MGGQGGGGDCRRGRSCDFGRSAILGALKIGKSIIRVGLDHVPRHAGPVEFAAQVRIKYIVSKKT